MSSGNMWLQRTCLIFQLKYREKTDFGLLKGAIAGHDVVLHLAAQKHIPTGEFNVMQTIQVNLQGSINDDREADSRNRKEDAGQGGQNDRVADHLAHHGPYIGRRHGAAGRWL